MQQASLARRIKLLDQQGRSDEALAVFAGQLSSAGAEPAAVFLACKIASRQRKHDLALEWLPMLRGTALELRGADLEAICHLGRRDIWKAVEAARLAAVLSGEDGPRTARYLRHLAEIEDPGAFINQFFRLAPKFAADPTLQEEKEEIAEALLRRQFPQHARAVLLWGWRGDRRGYVALMLRSATRRGMGAEALALLSEAIELGLGIPARAAEDIGNNLLEFGRLGLMAEVIDATSDPVAKAKLQVQFGYAASRSLPDAETTRMLVDAKAAGHCLPIAAAAWNLRMMEDPEGVPGFERAAQLLAKAESSARALAERLTDPGLRIAVVGSSAAERGRGRGAEIDAHDLVIRFNRAPTSAEYAADFGTRTTHVVQSAPFFGSIRVDDAGDVLFLTKEHPAQCRKSIEHLLRPHLPLNQVGFWPRPDFDELHRLCELSPSTGLMVAWTLAKLRGNRAVSFYGFSFIDHFEQPWASTHYFDVRPPGVHNWMVERLLFDALTSPASP